MANPDRTTSDAMSLERKLREHPYRFDFYQTLRRLEAVHRRQTARLTGVTTNTVMRLTKKAGAQAAATHDQLARHLRVGEVQLDEKWSFVGKKRGAL